MDLFQRLVRNPLLRAAFATRRAVRGPKRPSWSLDMEIAAEFMRLYGPVLTRLSPPHQRRFADALFAPSRMVLDMQQTEVRTHGVEGRWFAPRAPTCDAVIYYLHGGGYVLGSMRTHQNLIAALCEAAGCRALGLTYRLAPEHPFPAAIEDSVAGYRHLLADGVAAERIVIAGDSAGGGLTLATLFQLRDLGLPLPAAAVLISPWTDVSCGAATIALHASYDYVVMSHLSLCRDWLLAGQNPRHPLASPVHGDYRGLPPILIQVGGAEALLDDAVRMASRAHEGGVHVRLDVHDDMVHVFHLFASFLPEAQRAVQTVATYVREQTAAGANRPASSLSSK